MTIYLNGKQIEVEENDEVRVEEAKPRISENVGVETLEAKETLGSKLRSLPSWKKLAAATAAIAGGIWLKKSLFSDDDQEDDEEEDDETEEDKEE